MPVTHDQRAWIGSRRTCTSNPVDLLDPGDGRSPRPPGEAGDLGRQLTRDYWAAGPLGTDAAQDFPFIRWTSVAGLDTEIVGELAAQRMISIERVRATAATVQRRDKLTQSRSRSG